MKETMLERQTRIDREARARIAAENEAIGTAGAALIEACRERVGTLSGYSRHRRANQTLCGKCRTAKRKYDREHHRRRREAEMAVVV